jgi:hypothetical protein
MRIGGEILISGVFSRCRWHAIYPPSASPTTYVELNSHFTSIAGSMGDVENITIMIREDEFMLDVMLVTLQAASSRSAVYRQE